jgi:hypothetical protein
MQTQTSTKLLLVGKSSVDERSLGFDRFILPACLLPATLLLMFDADPDEDPEDDEEEQEDHPLTFALTPPTPLRRFTAVSITPTKREGFLAFRW